MSKRMKKTAASNGAEKRALQRVHRQGDVEGLGFLLGHGHAPFAECCARLLRRGDAIGGLVSAPFLHLLSP